MADKLGNFLANTQAAFAEDVNLSSNDYETEEVTGANIYVGVAGDIKVDMVGIGTGIIFVGVLAGTFLPIKIKRIWKTGTTASSLVAVI